MANNHLTTGCHIDLSDIFVKNEANNYIVTRAISEDEIIAAAKMLLTERIKVQSFINNPDTCYDFLVTQLGNYESEAFWVIFLNNQKGVIAMDELFKGTINSSAVYPREVVKQALKYNAANVILAHNHPSGIPTPSCFDRDITTKLKRALALVDIKVLDHIIVAGGHFLSFAKQGIL
jgi:DNA repair protein RadC